MAYDDDDRDDDDKWNDEPSKRLSRDLLAAAATLGDDEARFLVDAYYAHQEARKRAAAQQRTLSENAEPHAVIQWLAGQSGNLERQIKLALDSYTNSHMMGSYMRAVHGIGPVLSAGLLAHIYMGEWCGVCHGRDEAACEKRQANKKLKHPPHSYTPARACPTVGHIYQFAGIAGDGQKPWEKKTRRPYNAGLKTLCWKVGKSFLYQSAHPNCYYGHIYKERKDYEIANNDAGNYAQQAADKLRKVNIGKETDAYKHYSAGHLPPAHIDARARRYAVKLFLAHMHDEWYRLFYNEDPPLPYPIQILGHAHIRRPPRPPQAAE